MTLAELEVHERDIMAVMAEIGRKARAAARELAVAPRAQKDKALMVAARLLRDRTPSLLQANETDLQLGREKGLTPALLDRLALDDKRIEGIAAGLEAIAALPDPVGDVIASWERPNGLAISRVRTPLGVIGIIYESRPNVTADAGALCLKSGNASILRGGSESFHSAAAIHDCLVEALLDAGLPRDAIQLVPSRDRAAVGAMLSGLGGTVDVIVPRGGKSLVERVQAEARVPVFAHLEGICHVYVDGSADLEMAKGIVLNAKMRRTSICGSAETVLIDRAVAATHLTPIVRALLDAGCEVRGDEDVQAAALEVKMACDEDWDTEYLDAIVSVRLVDGVGEAIEHIETHGSHHTDAIVAENADAVERFFNEVDSAIVLHNASTQFADGGEFGMGAEIGIATGKFHARGPVGVEQLTSFKYLVRGAGQTRP